MNEFDFPDIEHEDTIAGLFNSVTSLDVVLPNKKDNLNNVISMVQAMKTGQDTGCPLRLYKIIGSTGSGKSIGFATMIYRLAAKRKLFTLVVVPDNKLVISQINLFKHFFATLKSSPLDLIGITDENKTGWETHIPKNDKSTMIVLNVSMFSAIYDTILSKKREYKIDEIEVLFEEPDDINNPTYSYLPQEFIARAIDVCQTHNFKINIFLSSATPCNWITNLTTAKMRQIVPHEPFSNIQVIDINVQKESNSKLITYVPEWDIIIQKIAESGFKNYYAAMVDACQSCIEGIKDNLKEMKRKLISSGMCADDLKYALRSICTALISVPGYYEANKLDNILSKKIVSDDVVIVNAKDAIQFVNEIGTVYVNGNGKHTITENTIVLIFATPTYSRGVNAVASYLIQFPFSRDNCQNETDPVHDEISSRLSSAREIEQMRGRVGRFAPAVIISFGSEKFYSSLTNREIISSRSLTKHLIIRSREGMSKRRYDQFCYMMKSLCEYDIGAFTQNLINQNVIAYDEKKMQYCIPFNNIASQLYEITEDNTQLIIEYIDYLHNNSAFNHRNLYFMLVYLEFMTKINGGKMDDMFSLSGNTDTYCSQIRRVHRKLFERSTYNDYNNKYAFNTYRTLWLVIDAILSEIPDFDPTFLKKTTLEHSFDQMMNPCRELMLNQSMVISCLTHATNLLDRAFKQNHIRSISLNRAILSEESFLNFMTNWILSDRSRYRIVVRDPVDLEDNTYYSPDARKYVFNPLNITYDQLPLQTKILECVVTKALLKPNNTNNDDNGSNERYVITMGFSLREYEYSHIDVAYIQLVKNNENLQKFMEWMSTYKPQNYSPSEIYILASKNLKETHRIDDIFLWSYITSYCHLRQK